MAIGKTDIVALEDAEKLAAGKKALQDEYVKGLEKQTALASEGVKSVDLAEKSSKDALRRQAAQALAVGRGSTSAVGGARLANLRATANESGLAEGNILSKAAADRQAARELEAKAQTELTIERQKLAEQAAQATGAIGDVDRWVKTIIKNLSGTLFTDGDDRKKMVADIRGRVLPAYANDPAKLRRAMEWIAKIEANTDEVGTDFTFEIGD